MQPDDEFSTHCEDDSRICIREFDSYEDVAPFWNELAHLYKNNELTVDLAAHQIIWERFYKPRGYELRIVVARQNEKCVGIFPFIRSLTDGYGTACWSFSDDFIIAKEYFCRPDIIDRVVPLLPAHFSDDLSCFYTPRHAQLFAQASGSLIRIKETQEEYFASLKKKHRHGFRRVLKQNGDIRVEVDTHIRPAVVNQLLPSYLNRWKLKHGGPDRSYYQYCHDKIHCDLALMKRAQEMKKLLALYLYLNDIPLAVNFSVRRETDRVDDYMCLRDCDPRFSGRGIGILSILHNMELCRKTGVNYYDMSSCMADYKRPFINMESKYYYLAYEDPAIVPPERPIVSLMQTPKDIGVEV